MNLKPDPEKQLSEVDRVKCTKHTMSDQCLCNRVSVLLSNGVYISKGSHKNCQEESLYLSLSGDLHHFHSKMGENQCGHQQ